MAGEISRLETGKRQLEDVVINKYEVSHGKQIFKPFKMIIEDIPPAIILSVTGVRNRHISGLYFSVLSHEYLTEGPRNDVAASGKGSGRLHVYHSHGHMRI